MPEIKETLIGETVWTRDLAAVSSSPPGREENEERSAPASGSRAPQPCITFAGEAHARHQAAMQGNSSRRLLFTVLFVSQGEKYKHMDFDYGYNSNKIDFKRPVQYNKSAVALASSAVQNKTILLATDLTTSL